MFPNTVYGRKHLLDGPSLDRDELETIAALLPTTVSVEGRRFKVSFDSADDLHVASMILSALRMHTYRAAVRGGRR